MINKKIEDITNEDVMDLIDNCVQESKCLEYKEKLTIDRDKEKKELLADISSFANTAGGLIIFGIKEDRETGFPREFVNQDIVNEDQLFLKIENLLRDGLEPRVDTMRIKSLVIGEKKIIIFKILRSFSSPHMVKFKSNYKFYTRTNSGKHPMDVQELRDAFVQNNSILERLNSFRIERVSKIISGETMFSLSNKSNVIVHILPLSSFTINKQAIDLIRVESSTELANYTKPMRCSGWDSTFNFEGHIKYNTNTSGQARTYVQFYKNGIVEAVASNIIIESHIPSKGLEDTLDISVKHYLKAVNELGINLPIYVAITLTGVKNSILDVKYSFCEDVIRNYHDTLILDSIIINDYQTNTRLALKNAFDQIWNAHGYKKSYSYDDYGNWIQE